jgi:hypothetical protein
VNVLHITLGANTNPLHSDQYAVESFKSIKNEADKLKIPIDTEYKISDNIEHGIVKTVNLNNYDFLLVGAGISLSKTTLFTDKSIFNRIDWLNKLSTKIFKSQSIFFPGNLIKDKTQYFIENSNCSVGIFINRGFTSISTALILIHSKEDAFLIRYARRLLRNNSATSIFIMDLNNILKDETINNVLDELISQFPNKIKTIKSSEKNSRIISKFSFLMLSYSTWNVLSESTYNELLNIPSTLIINKKTSRFNIAK